MDKQTTQLDVHVQQKCIDSEAGPKSQEPPILTLLQNHFFPAAFSHIFTLQQNGKRKKGDRPLHKKCNNSNGPKIERGRRDEKPTAKIHAKIGSARAKVESGKKSMQQPPQTSGQGRGRGGVAWGNQASAAWIEIPNNRDECTSAIKKQERTTRGNPVKMAGKKCKNSGCCGGGDSEKGGPKRGLNGNDLH